MAWRQRTRATTRSTWPPRPSALPRSGPPTRSSRRRLPARWAAYFFHLTSVPLPAAVMSEILLAAYTYAWQHTGVAACVLGCHGCAHRWRLQARNMMPCWPHAPLQTDIIHRLSGGAAAGRAAAAQKALAKIKGEDGLVNRPFVPKKRSFAFPAPERMGQRVLEINNLTHGYGDRALFDNVNLEIERGERVAVIGARPVLSRAGASQEKPPAPACAREGGKHRSPLSVTPGPNGCGKSTLLRLIMGIEKPIAGHVSLGQHAILPNYFEQNQVRWLPFVHPVSACKLFLQEHLPKGQTGWISRVYTDHVSLLHPSTIMQGFIALGAACLWT